jgi:hypothetical protein
VTANFVESHTVEFGVSRHCWGSAQVVLAGEASLALPGALRVICPLCGPGFLCLVARLTFFVLCRSACCPSQTWSAFADILEGSRTCDTCVAGFVIGLDANPVAAVQPRLRESCVLRQLGTNLDTISIGLDRALDARHKGVGRYSRPDLVRWCIHSLNLVDHTNRRQGWRTGGKRFKHTISDTH